MEGFIIVGHCNAPAGEIEDRGRNHIKRVGVSSGLHLLSATRIVRFSKNKNARTSTSTSATRARAHIATRGRQHLGQRVHQLYSVPVESCASLATSNDTTRAGHTRRQCPSEPQVINRIECRGQNPAFRSQRLYHHRAAQTRTRTHSSAHKHTHTHSTTRTSGTTQDAGKAAKQIVTGLGSDAPGTAACGQEVLPADSPTASNPYFYWSLLESEFFCAILCVIRSVVPLCSHDEDCVSSCSLLIGNCCQCTCSGCGRQEHGHGL